MKKILRIARLFKNILESSQQQSNEDILKRLDDLEETISNAMSFNKPYLTKKEAALYMGVSVRFVESLIRSREVTVYNISENSYNPHLYKTDLDRLMTRIQYMSKEQIRESARKTNK